MKKYLLFSSAVLVLAAVGMFIYLRHCPHAYRRLVSAVLREKYVPAADIRFRWNGLQAYNSQGPHGSTSDSSLLKSSDCVIVEWTIYRFPTASDAQAQFDEWIRAASKILESTAGDGPSGPRRAVLRVEDGGPDFDIISSQKDSAIIYSIRSNSLEHAALMERQDQKQATGHSSGIRGNRD